MAGKPQKNLTYSILLDFYGSVLTEKQRIILTEYYDEDLSLAEIAEDILRTSQEVVAKSLGNITTTRQALAQAASKAGLREEPLEK